MTDPTELTNYLLIVAIALLVFAIVLNFLWQRSCKRVAEYAVRVAMSVDDRAVPTWPWPEPRQ